jgi:peptide/nickel transport system substrate-binding protein
VAEIANGVIEPLVYSDGQTNQFKPGLAESWEHNADATSYTFKLRKGVKFTDGTPFNADAVKFSFDRIVDPALKSKLAISLLGPYDKTEVVDDSTVTIKFKSPNGVFLDPASRSNLGIVSPAAVKKYGDDFARNVVGTGPFILKEYTANQQIKLTRNPDYVGGSPHFGHSGPSYLDSVTHRMITETAVVRAAFEKGEIMVRGLGYDEVTDVKKSGKYGIFAKPINGMPAVFMMNVENPPLDDIRVRQALIYGLDRQALINISFGGVVTAAHGPLAVSAPEYDPDVEKYYPYDPQKAKQLLDEAGWKVGSDGIREKDGKKLRLVWDYAAGGEPYGEPAQAQYRDVGVDLDVKILTASLRIETNVAGKHHLALLGYPNFDSGVLTNAFHTKNIANGFAWTRYRSQELDDLLVKAQGEPDPPARKQEYSKIQHMIMDQALIVPILNHTGYTAFPSMVQGLKQDVRGMNYYYDVWLKKS